MRLQHLAIIFVIIFVPIILVTSYFIQQQVDTVNLQEFYDSKLIDATHDAMSAFEINTANEDLSSVADSLRSIIEASNNIFFNTLATNMGVSNASKSFVQPYIPAMIYTLYDGYYIYAPTNVPEVCTDIHGQTISTNSKGVTYKGVITVKGKSVGIYKFNQNALKYAEGTTEAQYADTYNETNSSVKYDSLPASLKEEYGQMLYKNKDGTYSTFLHTGSSNVNQDTYYKQSYILKSFVSYAANYKNAANTKNVTVNYTLDNFMTIEGTINGIYYTKSGYLINDKLVRKITINGADAIQFTDETNDSNRYKNWSSKSQEEWNKMIYDPTNYEIVVTLDDGTVISNKVEYSPSKYWNDPQSAVEYYVDAVMFSGWVYENLSDITEKNIQNTDYTLINIEDASKKSNTDFFNTELYDNLMYKFDSSNKPFSNANDSEDSESTFALHKRNVIKNSITYNLAVSVVAYTEMSRTTEYSMPVLSDSEWNKILSNVSLVTFMQGLNCGLKVYSNYAIISSTNNEITVTPNEIYYVPGANVNIEDNENIETAHRIDCDGLASYDYYTSFKAKEVKYDKVYDKTQGEYIYDHKVYTDYNCLVSSDYTVSFSGKTIKGNMDILQYLLNKKTEDASYSNKLKAYRIALAKERNNLYKSIEYESNFGYQMINFGTPSALEDGQAIPSNTITLTGIASKKVKEIAKIEVVISGIKPNTLGVYTDTITVSLNGTYTYDSQTIPTTSKSFRTLEFSKDFNGNDDLTTLKIDLPKSKAYVKSVKIFYK